MPDIEFVRGESACITKSSGSAARSGSCSEPGYPPSEMLNKIDELCTERDRLKAAQLPKMLRGRRG